MPIYDICLRLTYLKLKNFLNKQVFKTTIHMIVLGINIKYSMIFYKTDIL